VALTFDPSALFKPATQSEIFDLSVSIASGVGLPVSTWQVGDPTRTGLLCLADRLATVDLIVAKYFGSGFLSSAQGEWLTLAAWEVFQVPRGEATYASGTLRLKNSTTTKFVWEPSGLTLKNSSTGKTYKNSALVTLLAGATLDINYVAEEAGSGSTALTDSIDLQSTIKGVTVVTSSSCIGVDEQSDASLRLDCAAKVSSLSPNGAWYGYEAVAKNAGLTGVSSCRKAQAVAGALRTGEVTVYVSNTSSLITAPDLIAVTDAIVKYGTPIGFMPDVRHAIVRNIAITGQITIAAMGIAKEIVVGRVQQKLQGLFLDVPIGGGSGPGFTTGNLGSLLLNERVFQDLEDWTPGLVRKITLTSSLVSDLINPGELVVLGGTPDINVQY